MTTAERPRGEERDQTDESLRIERARVDEALEERLAAIDDAADATIATARARADAVVAVERAKNDARAAVGGPPPAVVRERAREDDRVRRERAVADESLDQERAAHAATLSTERDETDRDLSEERVRSDVALTTRDEVMEMVSHDLRGMLASVAGFAELIADEALLSPEGARIHRHAQRIQRSAGRMKRLVGDLVDVASIDAGLLAVTPEPTDPVVVAREAVDNFQLQADAAGVLLAAELPSAPVRCSLDPARTLQVLTNFLGNAIKFTERGGQVTVRVEDSPSEVRFSVEDTGRGIPASDLALVFERFHQVVRNDQRGMGLGLYISRSIVAGHGGRIWAESHEGRGSLFSFTIPRPHVADAASA